MARSRLTLAALTVGGLLVAIPVAWADYPTFDSTMVGKAMEQLKELKASVAAQLEQLNVLKEQLSFINDISKFANDITKAIGEIAHITLPIPNITKMASQLRSDARCLMPDGASWGISFKDLNLASICESSSKYRDALFLDPEKSVKLPITEANAQRRLIQLRRDALLADTSVRALAQGDTALKQAEEAGKAADQLQQDANNAKTVQDRAAVLAQTQILHARQQATQTQLMAQMLKLQAAVAIKAGLPTGTVNGITTGEDSK